MPALHMPLPLPSRQGLQQASGLGRQQACHKRAGNALFSNCSDTALRICLASTLLGVVHDYAHKHVLAVEPLLESIKAPHFMCLRVHLVDGTCHCVQTSDPRRSYAMRPHRKALLAL